MSFWAITCTLSPEATEQNQADLNQLCTAWGYTNQIGTNIWYKCSDGDDALTTLYLLLRRIRHNHGKHMVSTHFFRMSDLNDASNL